MLVSTAGTLLAAATDFLQKAVTPPAGYALPDGKHYREIIDAARKDSKGIWIGRVLNGQACGATIHQTPIEELNF